VVLTDSLGGLQTGASFVPSQSLMPQPASSEAFMLFANTTVFAGLLVLPSLIACYAICKLRMRRIGGDFSLGKLESIELDRAVLLYKWVSDRQAEIQRQCAQVSGTLVGRYRQRRSLQRQFEEERYQLGAYAVHLRSTIIRLRQRPGQRFKSWAHVTSSYFSVGCSLVVYSATWAVLIAIYQPDQPSWQKVVNHPYGLLLWNPVDFRVLFGNLLASSLALAAMPMLYSIRHVTIRRNHKLQLRDLRAFAEKDPDMLISELRANEASFDEEAQSHKKYDACPVMAEEATWFDVLGVSPSASLEEIKHAYKVLVKQSHPDRVHGMLPQFRDLAERETSKLNIAYEKAIASLRQRTGYVSCREQPAHG
jgi:DnaJ domain